MQYVDLSFLRLAMSLQHKSLFEKRLKQRYAIFTSNGGDPIIFCLRNNVVPFGSDPARPARDLKISNTERDLNEVSQRCIRRVKPAGGHTNRGPLRAGVQFDGGHLEFRGIRFRL